MIEENQILNGEALIYNNREQLQETLNKISKERFNFDKQNLVYCFQSNKELCLKQLMTMIYVVTKEKSSFLSSIIINYLLNFDVGQMKDQTQNIIQEAASNKLKEIINKKKSNSKNIYINQRDFKQFKNENREYHQICSNAIDEILITLDSIKKLDLKLLKFDFSKERRMFKKKQNMEVIQEQKKIKDHFEKLIESNKQDSELIQQNPQLTQIIQVLNEKDPKLIQNIESQLDQIRQIINTDEKLNDEFTIIENPFKILVKHYKKKEQKLQKLFSKKVKQKKGQKKMSFKEKLINGSINVITNIQKQLVKIRNTSSKKKFIQIRNPNKQEEFIQIRNPKKCQNKKLNQIKLLLEMTQDNLEVVESEIQQQNLNSDIRQIETPFHLANINENIDSIHQQPIPVQAQEQQLYNQPNPLLEQQQQNKDVTQNIPVPQGVNFEKNINKIHQQTIPVQAQEQQIYNQPNPLLEQQQQNEDATENIPVTQGDLQYSENAILIESESKNYVYSEQISKSKNQEKDEIEIQGPVLRYYSQEECQIEPSFDEWFDNYMYS